MSSSFKSKSISPTSSAGVPIWILKVIKIVYSIIINYYCLTICQSTTADQLKWDLPFKNKIQLGLCVVLETI